MFYPIITISCQVKLMADEIIKYEEFCAEVFRIDRKIRYVGIFHENKTFSQMREGLRNYLTAEDTKRSLVDSWTRWKIRRSLSDKIGNPRYSITSYDKIMRFAIPIYENSIILVSTEPDVFPVIIIKEILEIVEEYFSQ